MNNPQIRVASTFTPAPCIKETENERRAWLDKHRTSVSPEGKIQYPDGYAGTFVSIDGVDGTGKSTLVSALAEHPILTGQFSKILKQRQPGGSDYAEKVRDIARQAPLSSHTQALIFMSAIRDCWETSTKPFLEGGGLVITDRLYPVTMAYQGILGNQCELVLAILEQSAGYRHPDVNIYLSTDLEVSLARLTGERGLDDDRWGQSLRITKEKSKEAFDFLHYMAVSTEHFSGHYGYLDDVRDRFWRINNSSTPYWHRRNEIVVIDANQSPEAILEEAVSAISKNISTRKPTH